MPKFVEFVINAPEHVALTYTVMLFCLGDMAVKVLFPRPGMSFKNDITVMTVGLVLIAVFLIVGFNPLD